MSAETNKNLVHYFDSIKPLIASDDDEKTSSHYNSSTLGNTNNVQESHELPMKIEKTSVNLIKKIWDENKNKDLKLVDIDLSNYINPAECHSDKLLNKPVHCLVVNDNDEMSSRIIAINSDYILEFPQSPTSIDFSDHLSFSDTDNYYSSSPPASNIIPQLKFCDIIKICLSEESSSAAKKLSKKSARKNRSMSESYCDVIKDIAEQQQQLERNDAKTTIHPTATDITDTADNSTNRGVLKLRKSRSLSESCHNDGDTDCKIRKYKGILKHTVWNDSIIAETSEEERDESDYGSSAEKCYRSDADSVCSKKSVRFDMVIKKKLFKSNASIVEQQEKNHKKNEKKNARKKRQQERRRTESETSAFESDADGEREESGKRSKRKPNKANKENKAAIATNANDKHSDNN